MGHLCSSPSDGSKKVDVCCCLCVTCLVPGGRELWVDRQEGHSLTVTHQRVVALC